MALEKIQRVVGLREVSSTAGLYILTFKEKGQDEPLVLTMSEKDAKAMLAEVKIALHHDLPKQAVPPGYAKVVRVDLGSKNFGRPDEELLMSVPNAEKFVETLETSIGA